jgi:hypothetical protein
VIKAKTGSMPPSARRGELRPSPIVEALDFYYPVLVDCVLEWGATPESVGGEKPERFYDSSLRLADDNMKKSKMSVAACFFSAGQKSKEKKIFEIRTMYLIAVKHSGERAAAINWADRTKLLEESAETAAWPLFRTLFAQMASQTNLDLPLLPNMPKLRWLQQEKRAAAESRKEAD